MNGTGEFWLQLEKIVCPPEFEPRYADTKSQLPFPRTHSSRFGSFDSFNSFNIA
jgi:hypothetical protein